MERTGVLFGGYVLVEGLTATFLRVVAQVAFLKGQEKEIREVLPRTGCKVEFNQNLWPQKMERHTETFCLNGDLFQKISEIPISQWIWPIFERKWSHNALLIWLRPLILKVLILMALQSCNRCIKFNMDGGIWIRVYPLCVLHMYLYTYRTDYIPGTRLSFALPPKRRVFSNHR